MLRWERFFKNEDGTESMHRLLQFCSFFPATAALLMIKTTEALAVYMTCFGGLATVNKGLEVVRTIRKKLPAKKGK